MAEVGKRDVVYQGSKLYWRTRNTIDVTIVQHHECNMTEIIAYEPSINVEAKRIYLNSSILHSKLNHAEIEFKFSFAKQNNVPISTEFSNSVMHHAIADFILARLIISEFKKEECLFAVDLVLRSGDKASDMGGDFTDELICAKAPELLPFETKNHKLLAPGEVDAAFKALKEEQQNFDVTCAQAAELEAEAHEPLSNKERWRIPIVLIKLDEGKVLDEDDAKIWKTVSCSLKTEADIKRVTEITTPKATTSAQREAEKALKKTFKHLHQVVDAINTPRRSVHLSKTASATGSHAADAKAHEARIRDRLEISGRRTAATSPGISKSNENSGRIPSTPRNSSRLLAGTAASQARAQCAAEDAATPKSVHHKKQIKHSNSKTLPANNSKRSLRSHGHSRSSSRDNSGVEGELCASPDADHSGTIEYASPLGKIGEDARVNFASQVAAGLSSFVAATFSTKSKPTDTSNNVPWKAELKTEVCVSENDVTHRVTEVGTTIEALASDNVRVRQKKRGSYFGALLATLVRADSGQASLTGTTNNDNQNGNGVVRMNSSTTMAETSPQNQIITKKPSASFASWFIWKPFGSNTVVPVE